MDQKLNHEEIGLEISQLDRSRWHYPACAIILTHHNYSELVGDCLLSLVDQTYPNWECVVVDDNSTEDERNRLQGVIEQFSNPRIRLIQNAQQLGQVGAFFAGLAASHGEFVSPLDPDDRLDPIYLEEMVRAHLNDTVFCPIVSCEQRLLRLGSGLITGTYKGRLRWRAHELEHPVRIDISTPDDPLLYFSGTKRGWVWTSTSSLMVRRLATKFLVPNKPLGYNCLDSYLAFGAHFLGGTLIVQKPLVYRGIHTDNDYLEDDLFSMTHQRQAREDAPHMTPQCRRDVVEALFHNGVTSVVGPGRLAKLLQAHFDEKEITLLGAVCPEAYEIWQRHKDRKPAKPSFMRRLLSRRRKPAKEDDDIPPHGHELK
jgi:GT2 family glycosyltransferase